MLLALSMVLSFHLQPMPPTPPLPIHRKPAGVLGLLIMMAAEALLPLPPELFMWEASMPLAL